MIEGKKSMTKSTKNTLFSPLLLCDIILRHWSDARVGKLGSTQAEEVINWQLSGVTNSTAKKKREKKAANIRGVHRQKSQK